MAVSFFFFLNNQTNLILFSRVNTLIQGREVTIMDASEKINASANNIPLWKRRFQSEHLANFPLMVHELSKNNIALSSFIQTHTCENLDLHIQLKIWVRNLFLLDLKYY